MKTSRTNNSGFTIIEVVIVLALAAFIFTIVFFAVPQLQRALRDNQRNSDTSRVVAELINYQANNDGKLPADYTKFQSSYFENITLEDPSGVDYVIEQASGASAEPTRVDSTGGTSQILVYPGAQCDGESVTDVGAADRDFAVRVRRDTGATFICRDNA